MEGATQISTTPKLSVTVASDWSPMRKSRGIAWRAVGVSPPSWPHLTRRAYAARLAGFAATGDVTPLSVNPATMPFNLCMGACSRLYAASRNLSEGRSMVTIVFGGTLRLSDTLDPIWEPDPITVVPPRIVALL